LTHPCQLISR